MKHFCIIILLAVVFSTKLFAQSQIDNRMGIGISIDPYRIGQITHYNYRDISLQTITTSIQSPILFYLPINVTDKIRIEPLIGLNSTSSENVSITNYSRNTNSLDVTAITIGISGFYLTSLSNSFGLYFGPKLNYTFLSLVNEDISVSDNGGNPSSKIYRTEMTEMDIMVGLAFGVEYYPISNFSFGAEVSFNFTKFGNPNEKITTTPEDPYSIITTKERTRQSYHTAGIFFIRWYFL